MLEDYKQTSTTTESRTTGARQAHVSSAPPAASLPADSPGHGTSVGARGSSRARRSCCGARAAA